MPCLELICHLSKARWYSISYHTSAAARALDGVASIATLEQLSLPHSAVASALELPRQALDQA